jgi:hypothetical protein
MKSTIILSFLFLAFLLQLTSCSKDDPKSQNPSTTENTWKLDSYNYTRRISTQLSETFTNGDAYIIVNIDSNIATENTPFVNCNLVISFNTSTIGDYTIKSQVTALSNTKLKNMYIQCTIGSGAGTGAIYQSVDSNLTASVTHINGKYVITIPSNITLTRTFNDGLAQAPLNFLLSCNEVR